MTNENYKDLLKKFKNLQIENKKKKDLGMHDYSLINALLKKNREVELHSNFIYSMINPKSKHYKGNIFLKYFLDAIGISENEFNISNASVYKEKAKIDLMISNGEKAIIIENKLDAPDQKYQISRYIKYITESKYMNSDDIVNNLFVVYLSQTKNIPSEDKKSLYGFEIIGDKLVWQNQARKLSDIDGKRSILQFEDDLQIDYRRVKHSEHLYKWIKQSQDWLKNEKNSAALIYAFDEYKEILNRLISNRRNIMTLDEYTLSLEKEDEQKEMYAFMKEAKNRLLNYEVEKLWEQLEIILPEKAREDFVLNDKKFTKFTKLSKNNLRKWLKKDGTKENYRDIGFRYKLDNKYLIFALGVQHGAFGLEENFDWKRNIIENVREKNLFDLINSIKKDIHKYSKKYKND